MADTPEAPSTHEGGFKHFLTAQTGPLPNWVWGVVIVGTLGAVYVLPKFFGGTASNSQNSNTPSPTSLAIDPTTGLPYATEGLLPAGGSITPANATSNDYSYLYDQLQALQQQVANQPSQTQPSTAAQSYIAKLQTLNPGATWQQIKAIMLRQQAYTATLQANNPNASSAQIQQIMQNQQAWQAIQSWEKTTGQTWTGPVGSFPTGYGLSGPGEGTIQGGQFHYINAPAA